MTGNPAESPLSARHLVLLVCLAQTLVQIGAFFWPALLPQLAPQWGLSNSAAGWITAAFYGAYMLAVPVLVTLTDRIDPKRVYLFGVALTILGHLLFGLVAEGFWSALACRALTGIGWAGTYMTGLKLLADRVDAKMMSRATAGHAASIGLSGAASFATGELLTRQFGWQSAFLLASTSASVAWFIIWNVVPRQTTPAPLKDGAGLYDFRPVLRNSSAMACQRRTDFPSAGRSNIPSLERMKAPARRGLHARARHFSRSELVADVSVLARRVRRLEWARR